MSARSEVAAFWLGRTVRGPYLATRNGKYEFRLTVTDDEGIQFSAETSTFIDWIGPHIDCVVHPPTGSPLQVLRGFGGRNFAGFRWQLSREQIIDEMYHGALFLIEDKFGSNVAVSVLRTEDGVPFLRSTHDESQLNNLSNLPECTGSRGIFIKDDLVSGEFFEVDEEICSSTTAFTLRYQRDGNLALFRNDPFVGLPQAIWSAGTAGTRPGEVVMQNDGNLVVVDANGTPVWNSGTAGHVGSKLRVQDDGNVVIYANDVALWATDTVQDPGGLPIDSGASDPELTISEDGCLELYVTSYNKPQPPQGNAGFLTYQVGPSAGWSNWRPVIRKFKPVTPATPADPPQYPQPGYLLHSPKLVRLLDGHFVAFALNETREVAYNIQPLSGTNLWGSWQVFSRPANDYVNLVVSILDTNGCLVVFALTNTVANSGQGNCWFRRRLRPRGSWGDWQELGKSVGDPPVNPWLGEMTVSSGADGRLMIFGVNDGNILQNVEIKPGGPWRGWLTIHRHHI